MCPPLALTLPLDVTSGKLSRMSRLAIVPTTHSMEEAEVLCDRLGICVNGHHHQTCPKQHPIPPTQTHTKLAKRVDHMQTAKRLQRHTHEENRDFVYFSRIPLRCPQRGEDPHSSRQLRRPRGRQGAT